MEISYFGTFEKDNKEIYDRGMKQVVEVMDDKTLPPFTKFKKIFEIIGLHSDHILNIDLMDWHSKWIDGVYEHMIKSGKMTFTEVIEERLLRGE